MNCRSPFRVVLILLCLAAFPISSPAPLIFRAGEGWSYEPVGKVGKWQRARAKDQQEVAQKAFDEKNYDLTLKAAKRVVKQWPLSDYAPSAQYLIGRAYEEKKQDDRAFKAYQVVIEKYPKTTHYEEILNRQSAIADRFLAGQWFKIWGRIPFFPSMERTAVMYDRIIKNGPYSEVAPPAQMNIGQAREKQKDYPLAVRAYERAADRYHDKPVAADALYKAGMAHYKQAKTAEYDQHSAAKAVASFTDFIALYPNDPRVEETRNLMASMRTEQARGSLEIAKYYEKQNRMDGALIYYNDVVVKDPESTYATEARARIEALKPRTEESPSTRTTQN